MHIKRLFLLKCRNDNIIPRHIINISMRLSYVSFHSNTCKKKFEKFNKYFSHKLLKLKIQNINLHINFLIKIRNKLMKSILNSNIELSVSNTFLNSSGSKFATARKKYNNKQHKNFYY